MKDWKLQVEQIEGVICQWGVDLTGQSTFRLSSRGNLIEVRSSEALRKVLVTLGSAGVPYRALGWGANQVLAQEEKDALIKLNFPFDAKIFESPQEEYHLPASVGLNLLSAHAMRFGLKGWEVLTGIPASLGGAIYMNAGTTHGEICQIVKAVTVMESSGAVRTEHIGDKHFSYRKNHFVAPGEIIIGATLKHYGLDATVPDKIRRYLELRKNTQPLSTKNCGCVFKNYSSTAQAGRLIDLTGLKGLTVGALRISPKHANFMENSGGASAEDFHELVRLTNQQMKLHWGLAFELEVKAM